MGQLVHADLETIEEFLKRVRYGDLEMDDVNDILFTIVRNMRENERQTNQIDRPL